ncbi:DMT family transporter [Primorskyibacter aestuariivivens]|uniref:DMT family transporter n=1 Tax=Primorskyibacter aestuariivivens TaxID=1888912 RepID=UPI002300DB4A|nr:DMT family transporter [Primorskyibacter aestuariivivens]MDA7429940.1 DMT family transporter [Primorskyibacter aestuariivivens]
MQTGRGIALKLIALAVFTIMASLIKATSDAVPPGEAVFFRSAFALPVIIVWLMLKGELSTGLRTRNPMGHVWRGVIGVSAMGLGFTALGLLPLPEVTAIGFASPLITVILAALLLGEQVRMFRLSAVGIGLIGVLVILWPRLSFGADLDRLAMIGAVAMLISAALRSLAQVHIRRLVQTEHPSAVVFYFMLTASVLSLFTLPFGWTVPSLPEAAMLIGAGVFGGIGQIFLTLSYRFAPAGVLAPFDYASMLFAVIVGYVVFAEVPTTATIMGSVIVMAAGVLIIWRERQLGLQRGKARPKLTPMG